VLHFETEKSQALVTTMNLTDSLDVKLLLDQDLYSKCKSSVVKSHQKLRCTLRLHYNADRHISMFMKHRVKLLVSCLFTAGYFWLHQSPYKNRTRCSFSTRGFKGFETLCWCL